MIELETPYRQIINNWCNSNFDKFHKFEKFTAGYYYYKIENLNYEWDWYIQDVCEIWGVDIVSGFNVIYYPQTNNCISITIEMTDGSKRNLNIANCSYFRLKQLAELLYQSKLFITNENNEVLL